MTSQAAVVPLARDPVGRRERKKAQTRTAIQDAAIELFEAQGYSATTVEEIAEAADISASTFFRYFDCKEDLVVGDLREDGHRLAARLSASPKDKAPLDAVFDALATMGHGADGDPNRLKRRLRLRTQLIDTEPAVTAAYLHSLGSWEAAIAAFVRSRLPGSSADDPFPELLAAAVTGALRVLGRQAGRLGAGGELTLGRFTAARQQLRLGFAGSAGVTVAPPSTARRQTHG